MAHTPDDPALLERRKADHISLCHEQPVEARVTRTLLDDLRLMHSSVPELAVSELDMSSELAGHALNVPLMVSGMTGGTARATEINRVLASVADELGMAFGVGSQRAMMRDPALAASYQVRDVAPNLVLCGNIGAVQAAQSSTGEIADLVGAIDANALCIHLNPAQEMIQDQGDRDFRGCIDAIARLVEELDVPVIAKETGCGMSSQVVRRLYETGVRTVDVSGVGGTTWVGVESLRARGGRAAVGSVLWDWGIPTAATVAFAHRGGMHVVASGGVRNGLQAANAIALGADVASAALPFLRAVIDGGRDAALEAATAMIDTIQAVLLLTGSKDLAALRECPRIVGPELAQWLAVQ